MSESTLEKLDRYAPLELKDFDWTTPEPDESLTDDDIHTLVYAADTELETKAYFRSVCTVLVFIFDRHILQWLRDWKREELPHGELLRHFLTVRKIEIPKLSLGSRFWQSLNRWRTNLMHQVLALLSLITGLGPTMIGLHMIWGYINEVTTMDGLYRRLPERIPDQLLHRLAQRIRPQEARHMSFYGKQAWKWLEGHPWRQAIVRFILKHFWSIVGVGLHKQRDADRMMCHLFPADDPITWEAVDIMDRKINRVPGMQNLNLIHGAVVEAHQRYALAA